MHPYILSHSDSPDEGESCFFAMAVRAVRMRNLALFDTGSKEAICTARAIVIYTACLRLAGAVWSGKQSEKNPYEEVSNQFACDSSNL